MQRFRKLEVLLDQAGNPTQASVLYFEGGQPVEIHTWEPDPFHDFGDIIRTARDRPRTHDQMELPM